MKQPTRLIQLFVSILCVTEIIAFASTSDLPSSHDAREIKVTLFGQPCLLRGPFDVTMLKTIHEISPEQILPNLTFGGSEAVSTLKKSLAKLNAAAKTPSGFDRYRERLSQRIESQIAFGEGINKAQKSHKSAPLLDAILPYLHQKSSLKSFQLLAKKFEDAKSGTPQETARLIEQLSELYNDTIDANAEEEFHAASHRLGIKYACSYEETSEAPGENQEEKSE